MRPIQGKAGTSHAGPGVQVQPVDGAGPHSDVHVVGAYSRLGQVAVCQGSDTAVLGNVNRVHGTPARICLGPPASDLDDPDTSGDGFPPHPSA